MCGKQLPRGPGIAGKDSESLRSEEKPGLRDAGARFAHAQCRQQGPTGGDIVLHDVLERLSDATDGIRRLKTKTRGEFGIRRRAARFRLIDERLAETFFQLAIPIWLLAIVASI